MGKLFGVDHWLGFITRGLGRSPVTEGVSGWPRRMLSQRTGAMSPKCSGIDLLIAKAQDCDEPLLLGLKNIATCQFP